MLAYGEGGVAPETIGRGRKKVTANRPRFAVTIYCLAKKNRTQSDLIQLANCEANHNFSLPKKDLKKYQLQ
jgi:hypothetical protein